jgi:hypothetical protein
MDDYYFFFDRLAVDSLWNLSWQKFLRLHGKSQWAKDPDTGSANDSLRGLIAFSVEPKPSAAEVEDIVRQRTLRWTIRRSSPQFYMMEEIMANLPRLNESCVSLDMWSNDFAVLLAAAAEGYFRGDVPESEFKAVLKLHYSKFEDFIRLNKQERSTLKHLMDVDEFAKPIYPWQGPLAILEEQWASCLGVVDTRRFFALLNRLWQQNPEVRRILDDDGIQIREPKSKTYCFRDFGIAGQLTNLWSHTVRSFARPCVFRRWE